jgi:P4 family phage/plasmid primase-like protien
MHRDFFEFAPTFKLLIAGNHRPRLTNCGEAMRRRLHLIPCEVTIPAEARDKDLLQKLRDERDGILAWALAGCAEWQRTGLAPPRQVIEAAAGYFDDEDLTGHWIADCCVTGPGLQATSRDLYASWAGWARRSGVEPGSSRELGEKLRERGFVSYRSPRSRGWSGLAVRRGPADLARESAA